MTGQADLSMACRRRFIDGPYGQTHMRFAMAQTEARRPLILFHMFPQSSRNFEALIPHLAKTRTVVAPDIVGFGDSSPPPHPISIDDYASAVWDIIDALELTKFDGKVDVFAIHAGAKVATRTVCQRPERVGKLVISAAAIFDAEEIEQMKKFFIPAPLEEDGQKFKNLWASLMKNKGPDITLEMQAGIFADIVRNGPAAQWGSKTMFEYNDAFPSDLASLSLPVGVFNPYDDLYEITPRLMEHLRNGQYFDRPDWHTGYLDLRAAEVARDIEAFLCAP